MGIRKSPLGSVNLAYQLGRGLYETRANGTPYLSAHPELVRDLAEQTIAWAAFSILFAAVAGDDDDDDKMLLITGSEPFGLSSRGVRELNQRATGGEYVIRIGGRNGWPIHYGRFEPIATVLGTTADIIRGVKRKGTPSENAAQIWNYIVAQGQSKSFLNGMSTIMELVEGRSDPLGTSRRMALQAIVPNLIRQPLRQLDDYARDSKLAGIEYTLFPAGNLAEPKVNIYGDDVRKAGSPLSRLFFNAPLAADETLQATDKLLLNWNRNNPSEAYAPQDPGTTYKNAKGDTVQMTAEEARRFRIAAGRLAAARLRAVATPRAVASPTESDISKIRSVFSSAREETRERMFRGR